MIDFTLNKYREILIALQDNEYQFISINKYLRSNDLKKVIILRHDVDRYPLNSLNIAKLENRLGISSIYYFRTRKFTFKSNIIKEIESLGHEIGYHYENLSDFKGNYEDAIDDFKNELAKLRQITPIKNIAMHGSPISKWDNRLLWNKYNYKDYGIQSEPYFDLDFNKIFYLTDAGRSWNNKKVSIRDKVQTEFDVKVNNSDKLIDLIHSNRFPHIAMINMHPHNWSNNLFNSIFILLWQNIKNLIKRNIIFFFNK